MNASPPIIGITTDVDGDRFRLARSYVDLIAAAGGLPIVLPCRVDAVPAYVALCDGFVLSGGDDPDTRAWDEPVHPQARLIHPSRQAFELALLDELARHPDRPVLGVCLGMQLMALHAGGRLNQHLPDTLATAADHWGRGSHAVTGCLGEGLVHSHHRQAMTDAGRLEVAATAHDGVIEAVQDPRRAFYLGVQWHPERTESPALGPQLIQRFIDAAAARSARGVLASGSEPARAGC
jgi:putative glutamine amidotransferase